MIEPTKMKDVAKRYERENVRFRTFLKCNADCDKLDRQFLELHNELFVGYDCSKCRNCCRAYGMDLEEDEIESIALSLGITQDEFVKQYLVQTVDGYEHKAPCSFLNTDGSCQIQDCKPKSCAEFPHTNKPERLWSLLNIICNADVCPVVFEILQRLKQIYRFRSRR